MEKIIIIGSGGHAGMIVEIILKRKEILKENLEIMGILVEKQYLNKKEKEFMGIPILGDLSKIDEHVGKDYQYIIGIGDNDTRKRIAEKYSYLSYYTAIHPSSVIASNSKIGQGSVIGANAVIKTFSELGEHCILNTLSLESHHCIVENYSHISPNSTLCGRVKIGKRCFIGAGSTIVPKIEISENVTVGAGTVVIKNIEKNSVVIGNPGRLLKTKD